MRILNLGCGTKTSSKPEVVNIDWSVYLLLKHNSVLRRLAPLLLTGVRRERFESLPENILPHDLSKGIPFRSSSVDVVYLSQLLEHLDRNAVPAFLHESMRVLRPAGVLRIVVPDFALLCQDYLEHLVVAETNPSEATLHDAYVARLIEQSVRKEGAGTRIQPPFRRLIENLLLGDARKRGETHQWAYDKVNLREVLRSAGYRDIMQQTFRTSMIPDWASYGLDTDEAGDEYKPHSLYMEARK